MSLAVNSERLGHRDAKHSNTFSNKSTSRIIRNSFEKKKKINSSENDQPSHKKRRTVLKIASFIFHSLRSKKRKREKKNSSMAARFYFLWRPSPKRKINFKSRSSSFCVGLIQPTHRAVSSSHGGVSFFCQPSHKSSFNHFPSYEITDLAKMFINRVNSREKN
jgi:hypothetical protein